jgi:PhzF family phenazine biosynthesis protein
MTVPFFQVDAFAQRPFGGNPAAVCLLEAQAPDEWMQSVAGEMNLSETAFVWSEPGGSRLRLRWFTPSVEVDLCGHATLAAAHVLWSENKLPARTIEFETKSGVLTCHRDGTWITLDFPRLEFESTAAPPGLIDALGADPSRVRGVQRSRFDWLVELADESTVRGLRPDFARLARIEARGVIVTARADEPAVDFVSRFFAPAAGVDEDPVTGSAHCVLAPFWAAKLGRDQLVGAQLSRRGGIVGVAVRDSRVLLRGQAVTVVRGQLVCGPDEARAGEH